MSGLALLGLVGVLLGGVGCGDDDGTAKCGNGKLGLTEECDCGQDASNLPPNCELPNGAPGGSCTEDCRFVPQEDCRNGIDDDGDGDVDCDDDQCAGDPSCRPEICDDNIDNNGNGLLDCDDLEWCEDAPECDPEICDNGQDDNNDGYADCQDTACLDDPACAGVEVCHNGLDDNGDGYVDCDDEQCSGLPVCSTEVCDNGLDDDEDGDLDCADPSCIERTPCQLTDCVEDIDTSVALSATPVPADGVHHLTVDVASAGDDLPGECDITNGREYVIAVDLLTPGRLRVAFEQQGNHKLGLYFKGGPGTGCTAALANSMCLSPGLNTSGVLEFGVLPVSKYFLVVAEGSTGNAGTVSLVLSLVDPGDPPELCDNWLDDDGNHQTDCGDIACYGQSPCVNQGCFFPTLDADVSLGSLDPQGGWQVVDATEIDTRVESNDTVVGCGGAGAGDRRYHFHLDASAYLQIGWLQDMNQHGHHIFSLQLPGGSCDTAEHFCHDTLGYSSGVVDFPGDPLDQGRYPPGDYYLTVESRQGSAGRLAFQLLAMATPVEVCDDAGFDNDGDGLVNCADPDCATSHHLCLPEYCDNGVDDDLDGTVDCADLDPDDDCLCSYHCHVRTGVCDHLADPEIVDLGVLTMNQMVPFTTSTVGATADYFANELCVLDKSLPDVVLRFEVPQVSTVTLHRDGDTGSHVGAWYDHDRCQQCDRLENFGYCYSNNEDWIRVGAQPGSHLFLIKVANAGGEGDITGWILAN